MKIKRFSLIAILILSASFTGCSQSPQEADVISTAMTAYNIEYGDMKETSFPAQSGTVEEEVPIGGPAGTTTMVELTTKVEKDRDGDDIVTFIKAYNVKIGDKQVVSFWTYKVVDGTATLIDSEDQDDLLAVIK